MDSEPSSVTIVSSDRSKKLSSQVGKMAHFVLLRRLASAFAFACADADACMQTQ